MSKKSRQQSNIGRKFIFFIKPLDEEGMVLEQECGWLKTSPEIELVFSFRDATVFTEKEEGHGSSSDWKSFFEEEHPNWKINPPKYLDEISQT